jgi:hypothetical protein
METTLHVNVNAAIKSTLIWCSGVKYVGSLNLVLNNAPPLSVVSGIVLPLLHLLQPLDYLQQFLRLVNRVTQN